METSSRGGARRRTHRPHQISLLTDNSLCHGLAGTAYIARLTATDSTSARLKRLADQLAAAADRRHLPFANTGTERAEDDPGFLEGAAGTALALRANLLRTAPKTSWDTSLLINAPI